MGPVQPQGVTHSTSSLKWLDYHSKDYSVTKVNTHRLPFIYIITLDFHRLQREVYNNEKVKIFFPTPVKLAVVVAQTDPLLPKKPVPPRRHCQVPDQVEIEPYNPSQHPKIKNFTTNIKKKREIVKDCVHKTCHTATEEDLFDAIQKEIEMARNQETKTPTTSKKKYVCIWCNKSFLLHYYWKKKMNQTSNHLACIKDPAAELLYE